MSKEKKKVNPKVLIALAIILGLIAIGASGGSTSTENNTSQIEKTKEEKKVSKPDSYEYNLINGFAVDPATYRFIMEVKNTDKVKWEEPSCYVSVESASGHYKGYDVFNIPKTIPAGKSYRFNGDLTVTGEGAAHITTYDVDCN